MSLTFDFSNKHVFVAGGTSGINLGIADAFARAGANVSVCSRDPAKIEAAKAQLSAHGKGVNGYQADVRKYDDVEAALKSAHARFGDIDVLVSGAAGNFVAPATGISSNGFRTVVEIDLLGTFHVMRAAHQFLRKPGASLINISADQALRGYVGQVHVCAAKAGIDQITRVLALEWAAEGIRVNSVVPGPIADTEGMRRLTSTPEAELKLTSTVPLRRYGTKQEVADACMFLSSSLGQYITGIIMPVDGGLSIAGTNNLG
jgi:NAD(P)-dependent dehydrogenase (short-subunit alcohol dehydrogenase family)